jgi:hypothetical protein
MKVRSLLTFTGIVSSLLGALVVYLMMSVPNDLRADSLLKNARAQLKDGKDAEARQSLSKIVQQYPRTDAAAAATAALVHLGDQDRDDLARDVAQLRKQHEQQAKLIADLQTSVNTLRTAPPPAPVTVTAPPAPKPAAKKVTPKKKTTTRRKRR